MLRRLVSLVRSTLDLYRRYLLERAILKSRNRYVEDLFLDYRLQTAGRSSPVNGRMLSLLGWVQRESSWALEDTRLRTRDWMNRKIRDMQAVRDPQVQLVRELVRLTARQKALNDLSALESYGEMEYQRHASVLMARVEANRAKVQPPAEKTPDDIITERERYREWQRSQSPPAGLQNARPEVVAAWNAQWRPDDNG